MTWQHKRDQDDAPYDFLGREIVPGHLIVYPTGPSSTVLAKVVRVVPRKVAHKTLYSLKIQRIRDAYHMIGAHTWENPDRIVTYQNYDRAVVVPPDSE